MATITRIRGVVAKWYGLRPDDLLSQTREWRISVPRMMVWYLAREISDYSFPFIAKRFDRDHSTIVRGVNRFKERLQHDPALRQMVEGIKRELDAERDRGSRDVNGDDAGAGG